MTTSIEDRTFTNATLANLSWQKENTKIAILLRVIFLMQILRASGS